MLTYNDFHPFQKQTVIDAIKLQQCCIFMGTGLGKTIIALSIYDQLHKRGLLQSALVVTPKKVMDNVWRQEAKLWQHTHRFIINRVHGSETRGGSEYSKAYNIISPANIYLINYEGLPWLSNFFFRNKQELKKIGMIVYDESTLIRSSTTKRFKSFKPLMGHFTYRYAMTGTPLPNSLEDIFGQMYTIDGGQRLGKYITHFRNKYMYVAYQIHGRANKYESQNGSKQKVAKKIADKVRSLKKTEYLKLPPLTFETIPLRMPAKIKTMYDEFEKEMYLEFKDASIEAFSSTAAVMKLRQYLQGQMYDNNGKPIKIHSYKLLQLKELLKTVTGNSLIAYNFRFEVTDLKTITNSSPHIDGTTSDKDTENAILDWNNHQLKYLLVNPASTAFGLNLQAGGSNIIWYSLTYNLEHFQQLIDRLWRQGQRNPVKVYLLTFEKTVEQAVMKALLKKNQTQNGLINDISMYLKRRY